VCVYFVVRRFAIDCRLQRLEELLGTPRAGYGALLYIDRAPTEVGEGRQFCGHPARELSSSHALSCDPASGSAIASVEPSNVLNVSGYSGAIGRQYRGNR